MKIGEYTEEIRTALQVIKEYCCLKDCDECSLAMPSPLGKNPRSCGLKRNPFCWDIPEVISEE